MDVIEWDGKPIAETGAYQMPIEAYHTQCCAGPSISSSGLRTIYHRSAAHFFATSDLNPNAEPREETKALILGRAAHALLLGDEDFDAGYVVAPEDMPAYPAERSWNAKKPSPAITEAMAVWTAFEAQSAGRSIISHEDMIHIGHMAASLHQHPAIKDYGLFSGIPEPSLIWEAGEGCWIKSRPDMLPASGLEIADLKTTADIDRLFCERQIRTHGYDMQMALAIEGAKITLGREVSEAILVFVEKDAPYCVRCVPIDGDTLVWARRQNAIAIRAFVQSVKTGVWAGPTDDLTSYRMPEWAMNQVEYREGHAE